MAKKYNVKDGDGLTCTLGSQDSVLRIPVSHAGCIHGNNAAVVSDCRPGTNIEMFGMCNKTSPPIPCAPVILSPWLMGDKDVKINGEEALLSGSILSCARGGIIKVKQ